MRRLFVVAAILLALAVLAFRTDRETLRRAYQSMPRPAPGADIRLDGVAWRQAARWDFRRGDFPHAWSWGEWRIVDGVLEGREDAGDFAVYFCPCEHRGDFLLETRVRFLPDSSGRVPEAHLLTRDSRDLHDESGAVLFGGQRRLSARHMVDGVDYVLRVVRPPEPVSVGDWHLLRFAVRDGRVQVWLDERRVFRSDQRYPSGTYREPHFAVRNGVAQFDGFRLLVAS